MSYFTEIKDNGWWVPVGIVAGVCAATAAITTAGYYIRKWKQKGKKPLLMIEMIDITVGSDSSRSGVNELPLSYGRPYDPLNIG